MSASAGDAQFVRQHADAVRLMMTTSTLCDMLRMRGYRQVSGPVIKVRDSPVGDIEVEWGGRAIGLVPALREFIAQKHTRESTVLGAVHDPSWGPPRTHRVMPTLGPASEPAGLEECKGPTTGEAGEVDIEVRFAPEGVNVGVIRETISAMSKRGVPTIVVVSGGTRRQIHPQAQKEATALIKELNAQARRVHRLELFHESFFYANIAHHVDVPPQEVLSPEETARVLQEIGRPAEALHILPEEDPIAQLLGIRPGQVVRAFFPSPVSGRAIAYFRCK